jgi:Flp pilus assembly protein TadB
MPLSEHEQRLLDQLEQQLHADDPKFASHMEAAGSRALSTRHIVVGALVAVAGILVLLIGIWNQIIAVGVLGFVIMGGGVYWATTRRPSRGRVPGARKASQSKGGFMSGLEDRWDQRRNGEDR